MVLDLSRSLNQHHSAACSCLAIHRSPSQRRQILRLRKIRKSSYTQNLKVPCHRPSIYYCDLVSHEANQNTNLSFVIFKLLNSFLAKSIVYCDYREIDRTCMVVHLSSEKLYFRSNLQALKLRRFLTAKAMRRIAVTVLENPLLVVELRYL